MASGDRELFKGCDSLFSELCKLPGSALQRLRFTNEPGLDPQNHLYFSARSFAPFLCLVCHSGVTPCRLQAGAIQCRKLSLIEA
jgi:hypothetical protein